MKKYLIAALTGFLVVNMQTLMFALESAKDMNSYASFEQYLPNSQMDIKGFDALLSDNDSITLEKILLSPAERSYNDLTKYLSGTNKAQIFQENINRVNQTALTDAAYAQSLPDSFYKIYTDVLANPNASADFYLTPQEMEKNISHFVSTIFKYFETERTLLKEQDTPLYQLFNILVQKEIKLLEEYYTQNNLNLFLSVENPHKVIVKQSSAWRDSALHQKKLIQLAALRAINAYLLFGKQNYKYELARFDLISIFMNAKTDTSILLDLQIPTGAYKYVPFNPGQLVSRNEKFIIALGEIAKKKNYQYTSTPTNNPSPKRGEDSAPVKPSVYESPYGAGSVR